VAHESQAEDGWSSLTSHPNPLDLFFRLAYSPTPSIMKIKRIHGSPVVPSCCLYYFYFLLTKEAAHA
jgi:hypothetical protein